MKNDTPTARDYQIRRVKPYEGYWDVGVGNWKLLTDELKAVGYWEDLNDPDKTGSFEDGYIMPHPRDAIDNDWDMSERLRVIYYLDAGHPFVEYYGGAPCRFGCPYEGDVYGCRDLTDGTWIYPENYSHYLRVHAVKPPEAFLDHIRQNGYVPTLLEISGHCMFAHYSNEEKLKVIENQKALVDSLKKKLKCGTEMLRPWYKD